MFKEKNPHPPKFDARKVCDTAVLPTKTIFILHPKLTYGWEYRHGLEHEGQTLYEIPLLYQSY